MILNYKYQEKQDNIDPWSRNISSRAWKRQILKQTENFYKKNIDYIDKYLWDSLSLDEKNSITLSVSRRMDLPSLLEKYSKSKKNIIRENKIEDLFN
jgi:hypothetical protein